MYNLLFLGKNMKIAIGTERIPKVEWIKTAVNESPFFVWVEVTYHLKSVPSDISDMPLSLEETMQWAKNRAQNLKKHWIDADFYIGIEGGAKKINGKAYLGWIVYIENKEWKWHFWLSPFIEIPELIEKKLYEEGHELWPLMWELSGRTDIKSENGSMGAWSNNMLTRMDEFRSAFHAAISPFYNDYYEMK